MSSLATELAQARATSVTVSDTALLLELEDGRTVSTPLSWYPRLLHGTAEERGHWEICGGGVHWPDLDEDISVEGVLCGRPSGEGQESLGRWLAARAQRGAG